ncbi:MAG: transposase [Sphingomonadaceae bacterium]|jgi:hypothetical protein
MPRVIDNPDESMIYLDECVEALDETGFDPRDPESLDHAAGLLRCLGNNRTFLGEMLVDELAASASSEEGASHYGPQVIMLAPPHGKDFFIRANIWPSEDEHMMRASGASTFVYGFPHDHNFDFLTLGYFGPGYWSDYYEYEYEDVAGARGEPVALRFVERSALCEGKLMHYRAHRDVHAQIPADSLSVSLNVMHATPTQAWFDQYSFDVEKGTVGRIVSNGANEAFLKIAVGLGGEEAIDLADRFGRKHPSDRMRLAAWEALASVAGSSGARDSVWRDAERSGSRLVAAEARLRRGALIG